MIAGQVVCSGCGSDDMSCGRVSLLTKVTRPPAVMVTLRGDAPALVIVMVASLLGAGVGDGLGDGAGLGEGLGVGDGVGEGEGVVGVLLPPPQAKAVMAAASATVPRKPMFSVRIRRTSL